MFTKKSWIDAQQTMLGLLITSPAIIWSAWLTTKGLLDKAIETKVTTSEGMLVAFGSGVVVAAVLGTALIIYINTPKYINYIGVILLGLFLLPFVAGLSTINNILATAGQPSLIYDMKHRAEQYGEFFKDTGTGSAAIRDAAARVEAVRAAVCTEAANEESSGSLTGRAGRGAVYNEYAKTCATLGTVITELETMVGQVGSGGIGALALVAELKTIPDMDELSAFERQTRFRVKSEELVLLMNSTERDSGAEALVTRIDSLVNGLLASVTQDFAGNAGFGETQRAAIATLQSRIEKVKADMDALLRQQNAVTLAEPYDLLDMQTAIIAYWHRNIPQILLAILVDLVPLVFVPLMMHLLANKARRRFDDETVPPITLNKEPQLLGATS